MKVVYVAGPFRGATAWQIECNIRRAEEVGLEVSRLGAMPLIPHSNTRFFHGEGHDAFWLEGTMELLRRCDAIITTRDWERSVGAKAEVAEAKNLCRPVFHSLSDLKAWLEHVRGAVEGSMNDIAKTRLAQVVKMELKYGSHASLAEGACVMEAVSYVAGEPWSGAPDCACPVLAAFMRRWNDDLRTDEERTRLLGPLVPLLINSRSTPAVESRRSYMAFDWLVRVHAPQWLALANLTAEAAMLRALPETVDKAGIGRVTVVLDVARSACAHAMGAAWVAAVDASMDASTGAAWVAARNAAMVASTDAARVAGRDAAWSAAMGAARVAAMGAAMGAARDAAWGAAGGVPRGAAAALDPTVITLQASAVELVKRMCEVQS